MSLCLTPYGRSLLESSGFQAGLSSLQSEARKCFDSVTYGNHSALDRSRSDADRIACEPGKVTPLRDAAWETLAFHAALEEESFSNKLELFSEYPLVLPFALQRERVFNLELDSQIDVAHAFTAHFLGIHRIRSEEFEWRTDTHCTRFSLSMHGDLSVCQTRFPASKSRSTFFGEEILTPVAIDWNDNSSHFTIYQDASTFLVAILDFSRRTGTSDLREILEWRETLKEVGEVGTNTCEAFGGTLDSISRMVLSCAELLSRQTIPECAPLTIPGGTGQLRQYAIFDEGKLLIATAERAGDTMFDLPGMYGRETFSVRARFLPEDIPNLVRGTLKLFARDRSRMRWIMDAFPKSELFRKFSDFRGQQTDA